MERGWRGTEGEEKEGVEVGEFEMNLLGTMPVPSGKSLLLLHATPPLGVDHKYIYGFYDTWFYTPFFFSAQIHILKRVVLLSPR